jgi:cellulose synthase (UDP-forming)
VAVPRVGKWWDHGWLVRLITVLALGWGAVYLVWRLGWSSHGVVPALFVALFAAEVFGWVSLGAYAYLAWKPPPLERRSRHQTWPTIDVFVCTYDEPVSVVASTLVGCRAISEPHTTYLLDDGARPSMEALAAQLEAVYVTRPDNRHAKAGNINHALDVTHGELILMLDADHVPLPNILDATVNYFDDPEVALVQTPHDFSNRDSIQHTKLERNEQTLFYQVIAPGKDRDNAMFWCGSAALIRRSALESVGGVLTDTVAEDFHTTIAMHARGWRTRYHSETLVQGLAPHDLAGFLLQRARWARGNLGVFRTKQNPLTCRGLSARQRTSYLSSLLNYFSSLQRLTLALVLTVTLASGSLPMHASAITLAALWLPWSVLAFAATLALGRGSLGPLDSTRYGLMTIGINLRGIASLISSRAGRFRVTPKEGIDTGGLRVLRHLALLTTLGVVLGAVWVLRILAWAKVVALPPMPTFALAVVVALGVWELACIAKVIVPLVRRRQRRTRFRMPVEMRARIAGTTVRIDLRDVTPAGLGFDSPVACRPFSRLDVLTRIADRAGALNDTTLTLEVRSCRRAAVSGQFRIGGRFVDLDPITQLRLVEFCDVVLSTEHVEGDAPRTVAQPWLSWRRREAS